MTTTTTAPLHPRPFFGLQAGRPEGCAYPQTVHELGVLHVPSGRLEASDPFTFLGEGCTVLVPPGSYSAFVTVADVSKAADGSHLRESYLSIVLHDDSPVASVHLGIPEDIDVPGDGSWYGTGVDAGTVGFADAAVAQMLYQEFDILEEAYDRWSTFERDLSHYGKDRANVILPGAMRRENLVFTHSGWGDGFYPVITTHDADGRLLGVHIDLLVATTTQETEAIDDGK